MRKLTLSELGRMNIEQHKQAPKLPVVVVLDNLRSQHNIGSVFRTADAFRLESISLCGITATPPHREIQKTALGATESVLWHYFEKTQEA
ncbi:MAG: TrmH family RNA methyltransferase, partial [Bacteroidales bacterium]|nr:TrmH family RNA methyltransferase [Bacteroidales bacterium]